MTKSTKDNIKFVLLVIAAACAVVGIGEYFQHVENVKTEAHHQKCLDLDLKFGDKVHVKEGFYKNLEFTVVNESYTCVELSFPWTGEAMKNTEYYCDFLVKEVSK